MEDDVARGGYELSGPYPNPASQNASFTVRVDRNESVRIDVFDLLGRHVSRIHDGVLAPGVDHRFDVEAASLPAGVYFYTAAGSSFRSTRQLVLID